MAEFIGTDKNDIGMKIDLNLNTSSGFSKGERCTAWYPYVGEGGVGGGGLMMTENTLPLLKRLPYILPPPVG